MLKSTHTSTVATQQSFSAQFGQQLFLTRGCLGSEATTNVFVSHSVSLLSKKIWGSPIDLTSLWLAILDYFALYSSPFN